MGRIMLEEKIRFLKLTVKMLNLICLWTRRISIRIKQILKLCHLVIFKSLLNENATV